MKYRELLREGEQRLEAAGIEEAASDAWLLFSWQRDVSRTWYYLHMEEAASGEEEQRFFALIERRCTREPLQYITGEQMFMGLPFRVTPAVLVPRQDTEVLAEECLRRLKPGDRLLDMCTGSGCILISLLHYGCKIQGTGADISSEALEVARENADRNDVEAVFLKSDLFERVEGTYEMIVSNPPYIASGELAGLMPEVGVHEPWLALCGREDGLYFYREIVREAGRYLTDGGWLCFEIGYDQGAAVRQLMTEAGYEEIEVRKDLAGRDRVVSGTYRRERDV